MLGGAIGGRNRHHPGGRSIIGMAAPGVRVQTLVRLRWVAVAGQLFTLVLVGLVTGYPLPWLPTLATVALLGVLNLWLSWVYRRRDRIGGRAAAIQLAVDLVQLAALLFLTGGLGNPFSVLLLVPVTIAASLLSARGTAMMMGLALGLLVPLSFWHEPLPWIAGVPLHLPLVYRLGVLVSIALGMLFLGFYAWQVSAQGRRHQAALAATQTALERETRMGALNSLAAAAAHELGGPLGTITLIAHDLRHEFQHDPELAPDIDLLNQEADRCREILTGISRRAEAEQPFPELKLPALLREIVAPYEPTRVRVEMHVPWPAGGGPVVPRTPELLHGLSNLVSNALRHASSRIILKGGETAAELWLAVEDDGAGFPTDLMPKLGEPFLGPSISGSGSTGLGIFIAATLLERTGGHLEFGNRPEGGARVECRWQKSDIVIEPDNNDEGRS